MAKTVSKKIRLARARAAASRRWGTIANGIGALAFLNQATIKDKADISAQPTIQGKLKVIVNSIVGHATGFNPFNDVPQKQQNFNPAGALNMWTYAGLAASIIYPKIPKLPYKGKVAAVGKRLLIGGVAGGLIDDPPAARASVRVANGAQPNFAPQYQFGVSSEGSVL
jgi:hypothetical protein